MYHVHTIEMSIIHSIRRWGHNLLILQIYSDADTESSHGMVYTYSIVSLFRLNIVHLGVLIGPDLTAHEGREQALNLISY